MKGRISAFIFVGISIIIAIFLLASIISITIGAIIFAASLVILGLLSDAFRRK